MSAGPSHDVARAIEQPVELADHDPGWVAMFEAERRRLEAALPGFFVDIEHIGSTAVDGFRAKPLIDILAGVRSMDDAFALNDMLDRIGYATSPGLNATLKTRQWFMRQSKGVRTHHLHVVVHGEPDWTKRIHFRDRLRAEPALRARYLALKEELAARFAEDREAYTEGKSAFINAVAEDRDHG